MRSAGYEVIPVNPMQEELIGERSYPSVSAIGRRIDIVDIFRRSEDVLPVVIDAIHAGAGVIWMQEGIVNEEASERAKASGLKVVMDRCIMKEHVAHF